MKVRTFNGDKFSSLFDEIKKFLENDRFVDLKLDLPFKAYFEGDKQSPLRISFLDSTLPLPYGSRVTEAIVLNPEIYPAKLGKGDFKDKLGKTFILDLKIEFERVFNGHTYQEVSNVEMQTSKTPYLLDRIVCYAGSLLPKLLGKGDDFSKLTNVYSILLTTKNLEAFKDFDDYYHVGRIMREGSRPVILSDILTFTVIEFKKFDKSLETLDTKRECWSYLIKHSNVLDIKACESLIEKGGYIMAESVSRLFEISKDSVLKEYEEARAKQRFDQMSREHVAREEGMEKGRIEGMEKGIVKGMEKGMEKGRMEIISQLLRANMNVEQICQVTNLSEQEVLKIQSKIKS